MLDTVEPEPDCPDCGHVIPIVHGRDDIEKWARHTVNGSLASDLSAECSNSGKPWTGPTCPECGRAGEYGLNMQTGSFTRCPRCFWPGK